MCIRDRSKVTSLSFLEGAAYITNRFNLNKTSSEIADELYEMALHDYKYNIELKPGAENLLKMLSNDGLKAVSYTHLYYSLIAGYFYIVIC